MHKLLLSYSIGTLEESALITLVQYAREKGIEVLLPDRTPSIDGTANWYTLEALRQCTGVWGLVTLSGDSNDWVSHEVSLARSNSKPAVVFVERGAEWTCGVQGVAVVAFDRNNVQDLLDRFLGNVEGWLKPKSAQPATSGAGAVLGAIGAGLLLYWLLKDNK